MTPLATTDWMLLVVPGLIWGASFLFMAEGLDATSPYGVTFARIAIGFLTLSLFPAARRPLAKGDWPATVGLAVVWMAFPLTLFPIAEQEVSSAVTGMLNGATPLFVAAVASLLARQLPERGAVVGLAIGFGGAVIMAIPDLGGSSRARGILLILLALVSYGVAMNLARPLQQRSGALPLLWRALGVAALLTAPFGLSDVASGHWTLRPALAMLLLGALGTGVAQVLSAIAAGRLGATLASSTAFLIPVVALVLGVVVRHEHVSAVTIIGAALCLLGAAILRRPSLLRRLVAERVPVAAARCSN
jgi:drug/metabolite transporter (DMT)-like permease